MRSIHTHSLFPLPNLDGGFREGGRDLTARVGEPGDFDRLTGRARQNLAKQRAQYGNGGEKDDKDDGEIEDQSLYAAPCLEDRAGAIAAKRASQSGPTHLEQDEEDDDDAQYDLNYANRWKPLCSQNFPPLSGIYFSLDAIITYKG
jgi:hypothetical protein